MGFNFKKKAEPAAQPVATLKADIKREATIDLAGNETNFTVTLLLRNLSAQAVGALLQNLDENNQLGIQVLEHKAAPASTEKEEKSGKGKDNRKPGQ